MIKTTYFSKNVIPSLSRHIYAARAALFVLIYLCCVEVGVAQEVVGEVFTPDGKGGFILYDKITKQADLWKGKFPDFDGSIEPEKRNFMQDLLRVQRIIQQPEAAFSQLGDLVNDIEKIKKTNPDIHPTLALEQALGDLEAKHLFPTARVVALGILNPKNFVKLPEQGFVLVDVGAGLEHGELAHRLQWAMIMSDFEQNPKEWNNTPFELYVKIGRRDAETSRTEDQYAGKIWSSLFDLNGFGFKQRGVDSNGKIIYETDGNGNKLGDGLRYPDRLTNLLAAADPDALRQFTDRQGNKLDLTAIADGVRARYKQRLDVLNQVINDSDIKTLDDYEKRKTQIGEDAMSILGEELKQQRFKQWKNDPLLLIHEDDEAEANRENEEKTKLRMAISRIAFGKATEEDNRLLRRQRGRPNELYDNILDERLIARTDAVIPLPKDKPMKLSARKPGETLKDVGEMNVNDAEGFKDARKPPKPNVQEADPDDNQTEERKPPKPNFQNSNDNDDDENDVDKSGKQKVRGSNAGDDDGNNNDQNTRPRPRPPQKK